MTAANRSWLPSASQFEKDYKFANIDVVRKITNVNPEWKTYPFSDQNRSNHTLLPNYTF